MKILFCGDFVSQEPEKIEIGDNLMHLFSNQDYIVLNFEAPVKGIGNPLSKSGPSLTQSKLSPEFISHFHREGNIIALLANNHIMDMGEEGCYATMKELQQCGIMYVGVGQGNQAYDITVIEKNGVRVGLLNLTHKEFGIVDNDSQEFGTAWINHHLVNLKILKAKKICDYLIVLPHAGVEDLIVPLPEWRTRYKEFIDFGADAVIASHPHTPQGWEIYKGKYIFYSLGNFFFPWSSNLQNKNWYKGFCVELIIESNDITFKTYNTGFTDKNLFLDTTKESSAYINHLVSLLRDDEQYQKYVEQELMSLWPMYKLYLLRGLASFSFTFDIKTVIHSLYGILKGENLPLLINNFQCESHRWAIERIVNQRMNKNSVQ